MKAMKKPPKPAKSLPMRGARTLTNKKKKMKSGY